MGPAHRRRRAQSPARGSCRRVWRCFSIGTGSDASSSRACADPVRATRHGSNASGDRAGRYAPRSPRAIDCRSMRSGSASCGRSADRSRPNRPTRGPGSTTCRSSCSAASAIAGSCWRATWRKRSIRRCSRAGLPRLDLLKVAHHGSRTATTEEFVSAVRPRVAIASAGAGNPYGHPARATLERLAVAGARVYRTDQDGSVTVTFDASGMTVKTAPRRAAAVSARPTPCRRRRAFLCDVPLQPFVPESADARPPARVDEAGRPSGTIGRMTIPGPSPDRCPALAPASRRAGRWPPGTCRSSGAALSQRRRDRAAALRLGR